MSAEDQVTLRDVEAQPEYKEKDAIDDRAPPSSSKPSSIAEAAGASHPLALLSSARKSLLLLIFSISIFVDVCNVSGAAVAVAQIAGDIKLGVSQAAWILTAYSITFSSFLLFAGRLADLFPAHIVFEAGFFLLGVFSLVISFVTSNKYGFLILRGIAGICGAMTIPSSYHLVVAMYPESQERQGKLALIGLAGAIGNILGLVVAGICMLANYRWFFRVLAIICISFSILTYFLLPKTPSQHSHSGEVSSTSPRWKRMDVGGVLLMTSTLICFILSLTQGPIDGWKSASFIAPLILALVLGPSFFLWESRLSPSAAILPVSVWKITNMVSSSLVILIPIGWWIGSQLQFATFWQEELRWKPIHVAAAMLPQGIIAFIIGGVTQKVPGIITKPRTTIPIGAALIMIAEILVYFSEGGVGKDYWKFVFPGFLLGSAGAILAYFGSAINVIQNCPPEMAGVASAWTNVVAQVGGAVILAVQSGLQNPTNPAWKKGGARAFWFGFAWVFVLALQFVIQYKQPASPEVEHELARQRIKDAGLVEM
ncbi:hypothetical protein P7C70_g2833, partial [Phenoliferia sp. Uapishka_3]